MQSNPIYSTLFMYVAIAAIFYFVLWRPQAAQRKRHEAAIRAVKRGDEVVTAGGIVGEVVNVREATAGTPSADDRITIKSGESRLVIERGRIARIVTPTGTSSAPGGATS
jgi:preprotein translocase subunit YajC